MANNYTQSSSYVRIPPDKMEQANAIIERITAELESDEDEGHVGFSAETDSAGVWIHDDGESINPSHVEMLVSALVEELDLPDVHVVSWAHTCSKPRIDEFGGGAFAVQKGNPTIWVDAATHVRDLAIGNK